MDIFTHTLSGIAAASAIAAFSFRSLKDKFLMICFGAAGAMLPDTDAITRWSGFDAAIGKAFGLSRTGRNIYDGQHWYSHHDFMHSLAAAVMFTLAGALIGYLYCRQRSKCDSMSAFVLDRQGFLLSFFCGYIMHLLGDLPTPDAVLKGIRRFWPLEDHCGQLRLYLVVVKNNIINPIKPFTIKSVALLYNPLPLLQYSRPLVR